MQRNIQLFRWSFVRLDGQSRAVKVLQVPLNSCSNLSNKCYDTTAMTPRTFVDVFFPNMFVHTNGHLFV